MHYYYHHFCFVRVICFCLPTDLRRDCFKHRRPGILVNLKKYVDLEKDHMEMFVRYFTPYFFLRNSSKEERELS